MRMGTVVVGEEANGREGKQRGGGDRVEEGGSHGWVERRLARSQLLTPNLTGNPTGVGGGDGGGSGGALGCGGVGWAPHSRKKCTTLRSARFCLIVYSLCTITCTVLKAF